MVIQEKIKRLAEICARSYGIKEGKRPQGIKKISLKNDEAMIVFCPELKAKVVVFKGSDAEYKDWRSNFRIFKKETEFGPKAHYGFYESASKFFPMIFESIMVKNEKVIFTGHSRGGAMAQLAFLRMKCFHGFKGEMEVVTFGSPRVFSVGKSEEMEILSFHHTRFQNNGDRICNYPPAWLGFRHRGRLKRLPGPWWRRLPFVGLKDHDLKEYLKTLKNIPLSAKF